MFQENENVFVHKDSNKIIISFNEERHEYKVNGRIVPSVSEIMRKVSSKYYEGINDKTLLNASKRGKRVHEAVEIYEKLGIYHEDAEEYMVGYKIAKGIEKFEPVAIEKILTNLEYCGTLDMIALINGDLVIIDLKTTSKINTDLVEIQLAGYKELAEYNGYKIKDVYVLWLKKNGYKLVKINPNVNMWNQLKLDYFVSKLVE